MREIMFYILLSLQAERHGYGIMQHVKELTKNRIVLGAGTIYQSLSKLRRRIDCLHKGNRSEKALYHN